MICRYKIKFISDIEQKIRKLLVNIAVAPFVGVWIEISVIFSGCVLLIVAPFVGVWIEILLVLHLPGSNQSLPSWECGLKCIFYQFLLRQVLVAPFVGVWIEICEMHYNKFNITVAPFVGVWIEIH